MNREARCGVIGVFRGGSCGCGVEEGRAWCDAYEEVGMAVRSGWMAVEDWGQWKRTVFGVFVLEIGCEACVCRVRSCEFINGRDDAHMC